MLKYSLKRLASSVITLCIIIVVVFVLLRQMPIEGYFDNFDKLDETQVNAKLAHAVRRNRVRRQLREIYRLHETEFTPGHDLVVVVRSRAIGAPYGKLEQAYLALAAQLGLLRKDV